MKRLLQKTIILTCVTSLFLTAVLTVYAREFTKDAFTASWAFASVQTVGVSYPRIRIDGEFIHISDQQPVIINGRTLVPLRAVMEPLGFIVEWDDNTRIARLTKYTNNVRTQVIQVEIGSPVLTVAPTPATGPVILDVPAQIMNGRTMVPLRAISEAGGFEVNWDAVNRIVDIRSNNNENSINNATVPPPVVEPTVYNETQTAEPFDVEWFERRVFELVNYERTSRGLRALEWNDALAAASRVHSYDMARNNFVAHRGSDGSMMTDRARRFGFNGTATENVTAGAMTPERAVQNWMNSTSHRNQLLNRDHVTMGIGFVYLEGSRFGTYITKKMSSSNN